MPTREPSLGEVSEDIARLFTLVEAIPDTMERTFVRKDTFAGSLELRDFKVQTLEIRVASLEEKNRWLSRAMLGMLLFPFLVAVMAALVIAIVIR